MAEQKNRFQSLRGFYDILPETARKWQYAEQLTGEIAESYGYGEVRPPLLEHTGLFQRSVGDTTDIVQKEMYTFEMGASKTMMTLRPEGTAGTTRAVLEHGLLQNEPLPLKMYYQISCFRHESPQAGRQRQFHQFGIECYGSAGPEIDAEVIALGYDVLQTAGVKETQLYINSIGCPVCRPAYNEKLKDYYREYVEDLCEDCQDRLEKNPLRLLDCKEEGCQPIKEKAPRMVESLCQECEDHFHGLKDNLERMGIDYKINPDIVRGLDYYTKTVFEFVTTLIGAQGAVCGGGRYDGLVEELGGDPTPGIGFGMGLERLILVMEASGAEFPQREPVDLYLGSTDEETRRTALALAYQIRKEGFIVLTDLMDRSVRAQMRYADGQNAKYSCILGEDEIESGTVEIRNMKTGETKKVEVTSKALEDFLYEELTREILGDSPELEQLFYPED